MYITVTVGFRTYLRHEGVFKLHLAGNRFNILFYDAAGVYYLKDHMEEYLTRQHTEKLNKLLKAVLSDLRKPQYIAGCKALGILDKVVTGPFWRSLESSTISVLQMSDIFTNMKLKFDEWGIDSHGVLENND